MCPGLLIQGHRSGLFFTTVVLKKQIRPQRCELETSDATEGRLAYSSLTLTRAAWQVPVNVTIVGVPDYDDDGDVPFEVVATQWPALRTIRPIGIQSCYATIETY